MSGRILKRPRKICGVGVNDANYNVAIFKQYVDANGKTRNKSVWACPFYKAWHGCLQRSTSKELKELRPCYADVSICEEWLLFSNFRKWMIEQPWEGMQLDKDILIKGNRVYNPEACRFVPKRVNCMFTDSARIRGELPLGVTYKTCSHRILTDNIYVARCSNGVKADRKYLGVYTTPLDAHRAWQENKKSVILETIEWWKTDEKVNHSFTEELENALLERFHQISSEIQAGIETIKL